ncbi:MAG: serine/threonine-protein kinase [Candidatus Eremiobacterota bacterium]
MILERGTILNNIYRVVTILGKGAMGNVYLVERIKDDKKFVVKELFFTPQAGIEPSAAKEIFFREAEFMAKFDHEGIPGMYGVFSHDGKDYIAMDYIEGKTLEEIINTSEGPIEEDYAIKWTVEIASILDYLHNSFHQPVVYRDLKPSNIIITPEGKPKLVDFGIARYYNPDKNTDTFNYGSPGYAAPEQYKGRGQSTPQSDIFGLGVILFQMLTKYDPSLKPFTFPPMKSLNNNISAILEGIIRRAIQLEPLKRYISIREFSEALMKYSGTSSSYEDEKKWKLIPNTLAITGKRLAWATVMVPLLSWLIMIFCSVFINSATGRFEFIINILSGIAIIAIWTCPVAGLCFSIAGAIASRKNINISYEPVNEAIGCNVILAGFLLFIILIIYPGFRNARETGKLAACESNIKNIATALEMYHTDNKELYPDSLEKILAKTDTGISYIKHIPECPNRKKSIFPSKTEAPSYGYIVSGDHKNFTIWCMGSHRHYLQAGFPRYAPGQGLILK